MTTRLNPGWIPSAAPDGRIGAACVVYERYPGNDYDVNTLWVLPDGSVHLDTQPGAIVRSLAELEAAIAEGRVVAFPPEGARVIAFSRAVFRVTEVDHRVDGAALLLDVQDVARQLCGRPSAVESCGDAIDAYLKERTSWRLEALRAAYLAIPAHLRRFLVSMDAKDAPVRQLLEADDAHRDAAANALAEAIRWA
jgi:hypothetical protein